MRRNRLATIAFLAGHVALLAWSAYRHSPTFDEPAHLAAGLFHWRFARFDVYAVNPPLVRMVAALPVLASGVAEDWSAHRSSVARRSEFRLGRDLVRANGERVFWLMTVARWACIPFSLLGALVCYRWSNEMFGPPCGLTALALWCTCPNILAHGALITPDAGAAATGALAGYLFWRWLRFPDWSGVVWCAVGLGLCLLTKSTWLMLLLLWPTIWLVLRTAGRGQGQTKWACETVQMSAILGFALGLLNLGYGFEGQLQPLGSYRFVSRTLSEIAPREGEAMEGNRFQGTALSAIPVPLPRSFVLGIDAQKRDFEEGRIKFFRGARSREGWWDFYLCALIVKVPLGTWLLAALSILVVVRSGSRPVDGVCLLTPPLALLALVSCQPGLNHFRYLLPAFPFAFVWISQVGRLARSGRLVTRLAAATGVLATFASTIAASPHHLAYFNELGGGLSRGHWLMADSNCDWGQDLIALREWLDRHPDIRDLQLAYSGTVDPRLAGIEFSLPPMHAADALNQHPQIQLMPGWYAASVNHVHGAGREVFDGLGRFQAVPVAGFTYFELMEPVDVAGATILIYRVPH